MQISFRHHKHDGEEYPRHGVVEVALNRPYEGMVTVRPLRGCAPEAWLLPRLLEAAGVASVRFEGGAYRVTVASEWRYGTREIRPLGYTGREGSTSAYWAHYWALNPDGSRHHAVAGVHVSMCGRLNEQIWGYPDLLLYGTRMAFPSPLSTEVDVRVLQDPLRIDHPAPDGEFVFPVEGFEYPEPLAVPKVSL